MSSLKKNFVNPIITGFNPDPSICHVPGLGFFLTTSTFEYFPALPIYHSRDIVNWTLIGHATNRRSQGIDMRTVESSGGLWAPTIRYHKGVFYVAGGCTFRFKIPNDDSTETDVISANGFYVSTEDIFDDSKWSKPVYFEEHGIDQDLFFDEDGRSYLSVSRPIVESQVPYTPSVAGFMQGIYIAEIDLKSGISLSQSVLCRYSPTGCSEGSHIYKLDGWYYLFTAEGGTGVGHSEFVSRSRSPLGSYELPEKPGVNPIISNGDHASVQNTGHMDIACGDDGRWWAVFLGIRPTDTPAPEEVGMTRNSQLGRECFLSPMKWVDGWPVVNGGKSIELSMFVETSISPQRVERFWSADFGRTALDLGWYTCRTPLRSFYNLTTRAGSLAIRGSPYRLEVDECPSALFRKQTLFNLVWETEIQFQPLNAGEEAGVVAWIDKCVNATLSIRGRTGNGSQTELVYRMPSNNKEGGMETVYELNPSEQPVAMRISTSPLAYVFSFRPSHGKWIEAGTASGDCFKPLFTGTHLGLYAQGQHGRPCLNYAFFKYAKWEEKGANAPLRDELGG